MRLKKFRIITLLFLLVGALVVVPKWWAGVGENRLKSRIESELIDRLPDMASETWRVYVDGGDAVVHGTVSSLGLFQEVEALAINFADGSSKSIRGLNSLSCALSIPHRSSLTLKIDDDTQKIVISGELPAAADQALTNGLATAFPDGEVEKQVDLSGGLVGDAPWADSLCRLLPVLVRSIGDLELDLEGRSLKVGGEVATEANRLLLQEMLLHELAGSIDYVRNGLVNIGGEFDKSTLTVEFSDADNIILHGRVDSKATQDRLLRGVEMIAPAGSLVESRLSVRASATGGWWERPTMAFLAEAVEAMQGGEIQVDATGVRLSGIQGEKSDEQALVKLARQYFPVDLYSLESEFSAPSGNPAVMLASDLGSGSPDEIDEGSQPNVPVLDPDPDNGVPEVVGEITEVRPAEATPEADLEELVSSTQIFFSSGSTRVREAELEKLASLAESLLAVPEVKLDIAGLADPVGNASANRQLAKMRCAAVLVALEESGIDPARLQIVGGGEKLPAAGEPSWQLRRVEFAIRPAPEEVLAQLGSDRSEWRNSIAATQIYFDKNSTSLKLEGRAKLNRIATVLKADLHGVLSISGYTDPKGNRAYNERLSKLRCNTVHDYLIEQGVPDERLKTQPGGEITAADSDEPSWKLRRVQFRWIGLTATAGQ